MSKTLDELRSSLLELLESRKLWEINDEIRRKINQMGPDEMRSFCGIVLGNMHDHGVFMQELPSRRTMEFSNWNWQTVPMRSCGEMRIPLSSPNPSNNIVTRITGTQFKRCTTETRLPYAGRL